MTKTLLIVDDQHGFRTFAKSMLSDEGFDVTGEAADGESALEAVAELQPEAVLLDIQLPGIDRGRAPHRRRPRRSGGRAAT